MIINYDLALLYVKQNFFRFLLIYQNIFPSLRGVDFKRFPAAFQSNIAISLIFNDTKLSGKPSKLYPSDWLTKLDGSFLYKPICGI